MKSLRHSRTREARHSHRDITNTSLVHVFQISYASPVLGSMLGSKFEDGASEEVVHVVRRRLAQVAWRGHLHPHKGGQCRRRSSKNPLYQSVSQCKELKACKHHGLLLGLVGGIRRRQLEFTVPNGAFGSRPLDNCKTILQDVSAITRSTGLSQPEQIAWVNIADGRRNDVETKFGGGCCAASSKLAAHFTAISWLAIGTQPILGAVSPSSVT